MPEPVGRHRGPVPLSALFQYIIKKGQTGHDRREVHPGFLFPFGENGAEALAVKEVHVWPRFLFEMIINPTIQVKVGSPGVHSIGRIH